MGSPPSLFLQSISAIGKAIGNILDGTPPSKYIPEPSRQYVPEPEPKTLTSPEDILRSQYGSSQHSYVSAETGEYSVTWKAHARRALLKFTEYSCRRLEARQLGESYIEKYESSLKFIRRESVDSFAVKKVIESMINKKLIPLVGAERVTVSINPNSESGFIEDTTIKLASMRGYEIEFSILHQNILVGGAWIKGSKPVDLN